MKILIVLPTQGAVGGIELFAMTLAEWLDRQPGLDVRICFKLVTGHEWSPRLKARCAELNLATVFCQRGSPALWSAIRWADVVHANNTPPDVILPACLLRKPVVLTVHNWRRRAPVLRTLLWKLCHDIADYRTYNSRFVMRTWTGSRPDANAEVIPAVARFAGTRVPPTERRGFFFVSRWIEGKGIPELIEAYGAARLDKQAWPLVMAGDGPLRAGSQAQVADAEMEGISILGFVSDEQKYGAMAAARWLICAPDHREDMGLTPIEARQLGVPCIASVDGGVPEAAGPNALFVPPGDVAALTRALELAACLPEALYASRADAARDSLASYLRPLEVYLHIYQAVVGNRSALATS